MPMRYNNYKAKAISRTIVRYYTYVHCMCVPCEEDLVLALDVNVCVGFCVLVGFCVVVNLIMSGLVRLSAKSNIFHNTN